MPFTLATTYNGQPIYTMPTQKLRTVDLSMYDSISVSTSTWTGQRQTYDWMADKWEADVTLPSLTTRQVGVWTAWLANLHGQAGYFWLGHPLYVVPFGSALGTPLVNGASQTGRTLNTKGWTANSNGLLLPGDYFQIGLRLHLVTQQVNSDSSGNASISIWPCIRESQADGAFLNLSNPQGLFALKSNTRKFTSNEAKTWGISFSCTEAL
jgi:hypothetical protein